MKTYKVTIDSQNTICWYKPNTKKLHRTDGPAVEWADGRKEWFVDGKPHRTDGPAVEHFDGHKEWYVDNKRHRTDGPAIEHAGGGKVWWVDGKLHRTDGPAIEHADGGKEWWVDDKEYTEKQFDKLMNQQDCYDGKIVEIEGKKFKLVSV